MYFSDLVINSDRQLKPSQHFWRRWYIKINNFNRILKIIEIGDSSLFVNIYLCGFSYLHNKYNFKRLHSK